MKLIEERLDDGGPAFPWTTCSGEGYCGQNGHNDGMSLRDYFAKAAMEGEIVSQGLEGREARHIAGMAYEMADAMLEARKPKPLSVDEVKP